MEIEFCKLRVLEFMLFDMKLIDVILEWLVIMEFFGVG